MEKVTVLKTGLFALHSAWGPIVDLQEGEAFEGKPEQVDELVKNGWAEPEPGSELEPELTFTEVETVEELAAIIAGLKDSIAKSTIEQWAVANYEVNIDLEESVPVLLAQLQGLETTAIGDPEESGADNVAELTEYVSSLENSVAKLSIKQWGIDNYGVSVSMAKSIDNMLAELLGLEQAGSELSE